MKFYGRAFVTGVVLTLGVTLGAGVANATSSPPRVHGWLHFTSAAGDPVGHGLANVKLPVVARPGALITMGVRTLWDVDNSIAVQVVQKTPEGKIVSVSDLYLASGDGKPLQKGYYANALREGGGPRVGHPGLFFAYAGAGCNQLSGDFTVNQIKRAANGHITLLDVRFNQKCDNATAGLSGKVRYVEL